MAVSCDCISALYVDDDKDLLDIGKFFLEKRGSFHVDLALSADEALEKITGAHYDAVVSDYQMPVMDGIELLKKIRIDHPFLPFILFTGRGREEVVVQALDAGADSYVQKGGDIEAQFIELSHKILRAVEHRENQQLLLESEATYRTIFENTGTGMVIIEEDMTISLANEEFARLAGYSRGEIEGTLKWTRFTDENDQGSMINQHKLRRKDPERALPQYKFLMKTKSGSTRRILLNIAMIPGTSRSVASLIDISDIQVEEIAIASII